MYRVAIIVGTRPEAIKMAPVIKVLEQTPAVRPIVIATAQHRDMLDQVLSLFQIEPAHDLNLMSRNQNLGELSGRLIESMFGVLSECNADYVLVHGDTTTTFLAALASYYQKIPVGHVEAGLRTHRFYEPFPEEKNRQLTAAVTTLHFAPTVRAKRNLIAEGIADNSILVTGNTAVDAALMMSKQLDENFAAFKHDLAADIGSRSQEIFSQITGKQNLILLTVHRRESFDVGIFEICAAIETLARAYPETLFVLPVHKNPNVYGPLHTKLGQLPNVALTEPLSYRSFVYLLRHARLVMTDSGGVQEEAPSFGIPVLVLRDVTERPEAVEAGLARVAGTSCTSIVGEARSVLDGSAAWLRTQSENPYGDGKAAERIVARLLQELSSQQGYLVHDGV